LGPKSVSEEEIIATFRERWPRTPGDGSLSAELIALVNEGTDAFPNSAVLWRIRGDLLQLLDTAYPLKEAERSYRRSIRADRFYADAYEELGRFFDAVMGKPRKAKRFLEKARRLRKAMPNKPLQATRSKQRAPEGQR
jgi:tetratricopeptide (TPR) repeat protein